MLLSAYHLDVWRLENPDKEHTRLVLTTFHYFSNTFCSFLPDVMPIHKPWSRLFRRHLCECDCCHAPLLVCNSLDIGVHSYSTGWPSTFTISFRFHGCSVSDSSLSPKCIQNTHLHWDGMMRDVWYGLVFARFRRRYCNQTLAMRLNFHHFPSNLFWRR